MIQAALQQDKLVCLHNVSAYQQDAVVEPVTSDEMGPEDMRAIVLLAAPAMEQVMLDFVVKHAQVLKRFRLSATKTLLTKLKAALGSAMHVALEFKSALLGADSQCATQMVIEDVGLVIYFTNPLSCEPYQADADALLRLINVSNVLHATNRTTALALMEVLAEGLVPALRSGHTLPFYLPFG